MIDPQDLMLAFEGMVNAYRALHDPSHPLSREILFWRERFLAFATLPEDPDKAAKIWATFLFTPSETMVRTSPEEYFEEIKKLVEDET